MAKHVWSVLCERVSIDQRTNLVSYLTCMEGVAASQLPIAVPALAIGSLWLRDVDEEHSFVFRLVIIGPDKSQKMLIEGSQEWGPNGKARTTFVMDSFPIEQTGQYVFRIETQNAGGDWESQAMLPLDVELRTGEQAGETGKNVSDSATVEAKDVKREEIESTRSVNKKAKVRT